MEDTVQNRSTRPTTTVQDNTSEGENTRVEETFNEDLITTRDSDGNF